MVINETECITLAHNLKGDVVGHAFYGTQRVLEALQQFPGWSTGHVTITPELVKRSSTTGLVCDIVPPMEGKSS